MADRYSGQTIIFEDNLGQHYDGIVSGDITDLSMGWVFFFSNSDPRGGNSSIGCVFDVYYKNSSGTMVLDQRYNGRIVSGSTWYDDSYRVYFDNAFASADAKKYITGYSPKVEIRFVSPTLYFGAREPLKTLSPTYKPITVSNIAISQRYTDKQTMVTFNANNMTNFTLNIKNGSTVLYTVDGSSSPSIVVPQDKFTVGLNTVEIIARNSNVTGTSNTNFTFENTTPQVTTLEPDSVNQNLNSPIIVSWTSTYQSVFKLTVDGNIYTGTTATALTIPANTLTSGTKTMTLEVTYIPIWATSTADHRKTTKTVSFLAYGNPPTPTLLNKTIISSATPLIKWDSTEQVAYEFKLLDGMSNAEVTGEALSGSKQYQVITALENNKLYTIKLRVKNQYGLWSEYATSTFTTSFVVPNTPVISGFANISNGSIVLNVATETSTEYKNTEIWRKEPYGEWVRMAYNLAELDTWVDNYVKGGTAYEYKARSIGQTGGIVESDAVSLSTTVNGYNFYNLEDLNSNITFKYNSEVVPTFNRNEALTMYAGCLAPSYETDNVMYQTLSMTFATKTPSDIDRFINLIRTTKVFLYKDLKGRKVFGMITGNFSPKLDDFNVTTISFAFTELSFLEQDVYAGDNTGLKLLMWDGTWMFDGTYAFGGA